MKQIEVAALLGMDTVNLSRFERNVRLPRLKGAIALEMLFNARTADFFPEFTYEVIEGLLDRLDILEAELEKAATPKSRHTLASLADMRTRLKIYRQPFV